MRWPILHRIASAQGLISWIGYEPALGPLTMGGGGWVWWRCGGCLRLRLCLPCGRWNPDKKLSTIALGNTYRFQMPVWYMVWGDAKTGGYVAYVDASNGKVLKKK